MASTNGHLTPVELARRALAASRQQTTAVDLAFITPHIYQQLILDHPARFKVVACGRKFGKTALAQRVLGLRAAAGENVAYFAPTNKMGAEYWRMMLRLLKPVTAKKNETDRRIETKAGGVLECWSLDNADSVRPGNYHFIVVDEAAFIPSKDIWYEVLRPLLTVYKGGALFLSTPKGHNWFWELYNQGQDPLQEHWQSWNFPTVANPYIDPAEVEDARATLPLRSFEQEYLAAFTEDAGAVFRNVDGVSTLAPSERQENGNYIFGVDWARDNDFTVISVLDTKARRQVHLERFNQIGWGLQRGRLRALYDHWKPGAIYAEENSMGGPNVEALQADGLPVYPFATTAQSKRAVIEALALAIEQNAVALLDDPVQKLELKAFQMERLPGGMFRYSAPSGAHDDTVMALAIAWNGCLQGVIAMPIVLG